MKDTFVLIEGKQIHITHTDKLLWPERAITKLRYIEYLVQIAPYLLSYTKDRMLMLWRYPDGVQGRRIEERSIHSETPEWVPRVVYKDKDRVLLNDAATLVWAANRNACELHVPFDTYDRKDFPTELVFDLDPPNEYSFDLAVEVAFVLKEVLDGLSLRSVPKTSGATGIQVFVPIEPKYSFEETRVLNTFIAEYMRSRMPDKITLERVVERRRDKLYFDYLQLWRGRTMAAPYSVRATPLANVSTPVTWEELAAGIASQDFDIDTVPRHIQEAGDPFQIVSGTASGRLNQNLDPLLSFVRTHGGKR